MASLASASFPVGLFSLQNLDLFIVPANAAEVQIDCDSDGAYEQDHSDYDPGNESTIAAFNYFLDDYDIILILDFWCDKSTGPWPARRVNKD